MAAIDQHAVDAAKAAEHLGAFQRFLPRQTQAQANHVHQVPLHHPHVLERRLCFGLRRGRRGSPLPLSGRGTIPLLPSLLGLSPLA